MEKKRKNKENKNERNERSEKERDGLIKKQTKIKTERRKTKMNEGKKVCRKRKGKNRKR